MAGLVLLTPPAYVEADPEYHILSLINTWSMFLQKHNRYTIITSETIP